MHHHACTGCKRTKELLLWALIYEEDFYAIQNEKAHSPQ
jgi:hypothetical protein